MKSLTLSLNFKGVEEGRHGTTSLSNSKVMYLDFNGFKISLALQWEGLKGIDEPIKVEDVSSYNFLCIVTYNK